MAQVGRPINKLHQEDVRKKIQVSQLRNGLQNHALGVNEDELSPTRMKAIEILLRTSMPDMASVTIRGASDPPSQDIVTWAK